jgi:DNA-binding transcriptional LysR family regulator
MNATLPANLAIRPTSAALVVVRPSLHRRAPAWPATGVRCAQHLVPITPGVAGRRADRWTGAVDLRRLRVFLAVADAGGIAAAARRLHLDPSAVSRLVAALERDLGAALLTRSRSGTKPTPAGRLLAEQGRTLLEDARLLALRTARAAAATSPGLRLGLPNELPPGLLSAALPALRPRVGVRVGVGVEVGVEVEVEVEVVEASSAENLDNLRRGEVDVALTREPPGDGLVTAAVLDEPLGVLLPADHPALDAPGPVDLAGLDPARWLGFAREHSPRYHDRIAATCRGAGLRVVEGSDDLTSKVHMVAAGLGVSFAPRARAAGLTGLGVAWRPVVQEITRRTHLARRVTASPHVEPTALALAAALQRVAPGGRPED